MLSITSGELAALPRRAAQFEATRARRVFVHPRCRENAPTPPPRSQLWDCRSPRLLAANSSTKTIRIPRAGRCDLLRDRTHRRMPDRVSLHMRDLQRAFSRQEVAASAKGRRTRTRCSHERTSSGHTTPCARIAPAEARWRTRRARSGWPTSRVQATNSASTAACEPWNCGRCSRNCTSRETMRAVARALVTQAVHLRDRSNRCNQRLGAFRVRRIKQNSVFFRQRCPPTSGRCASSMVDAPLPARDEAGFAERTRAARDRLAGRLGTRVLDGL